MADEPRKPGDEPDRPDAEKAAAEGKEAPDDVMNATKEPSARRDDGSIDKERLKEEIDAQKARAQEAEKELAENQGEDRERVKSEEDIKAEAAEKAAEADANYLGEDTGKGG